MLFLIERRNFMLDPIIEKLCEENGLTPDAFITEEELAALGEPDEKPDEDGEG